MQGVARLSDGRAVFIPFALPGEDVEIRLTKEKERFAEARLLNVINSSPDRVKPDCPYYGSCGGCQTRHMTYEASLKYKREKVYAAVTRLGGLNEPEVLDTLPSPETCAYRNKAEYACAADFIGFYREGTRQILDIDSCLLQGENVNRTVRALRPRLKNTDMSGAVLRVNSAGEIMLILTGGSVPAGTDKFIDLAPEIKSVHFYRLRPRPAHALDGRCTLLAGAERLDETLNGLSFSISPQSFFQVNRRQAERLYDAALDLANLTENDEICDIYCGAGTITLNAAGRCKSVIGIEIVPEAISDARKNAGANRLSGQTQFLCADAAQAYPPLARRKKFNAVFVDPPRKGLDKAVVDALIAAPTEKLIYVSCDPATLARDIKLLTHSGVYRFVKAQPVDMFPGTSHVETVCCLYHHKKDFISVPYEPKDASYLKHKNELSILKENKQ